MRGVDVTCNISKKKKTLFLKAAYQRGPACLVLSTLGPEVLMLKRRECPIEIPIAGSHVHGDCWGMVAPSTT